MKPLSEEDVRAVLREYPDADFTQHELVEGVDVEALVRDEARKTFDAIEKRARQLRTGMSIAHDSALIYEGPKLLCGLLNELDRLRRELIMSDGNWMQEAVREFMLATGGPKHAPERLSLDTVRLELRAKLIMEEALETVEALGFTVYAIADPATAPHIELRPNGKAPDWPEVVDGLCDLMYVTLGTAVEAGFRIGPFFAEVHRSNMTKVTGFVRDDGKVLKPEGWKPPRIRYLWERVVERAKSGHRTA
jgi:predicted HAD superfamily Cof-like phosphohydrolase